ncbi:hypothetical protein H5P28_11805 [Ruficoccus amylovorans]|uniref:Large polyvalent protein associated domain-containing protein n=1 Tax=Ruficoccus amylovorans TaxID=1804625 RepID=A0A842HET4_9BACT|nr:LPD38 domain-containing protein [Ruficoccus amylovorans]MBC2594942.1 hypothetical protein [Ruficoccus amylovorans]
MPDPQSISKQMRSTQPEREKQIQTPTAPSEADALRSAIEKRTQERDAWLKSEGRKLLNRQGEFDPDGDSPFARSIRDLSKITNRDPDRDAKVAKLEREKKALLGTHARYQDDIDYFDKRLIGIQRKEMLENARSINTPGMPRPSESQPLNLLPDPAQVMQQQQTAATAAAMDRLQANRQPVNPVNDVFAPGQMPHAGQPEGYHRVVEGQPDGSTQVKDVPPAQPVSFAQMRANAQQPRQAAVTAASGTPGATPKPRGDEFGMLRRMKAEGVTHVGSQPIDKMIRLYAGTDNEGDVKRLERWVKMNGRIGEIDAAFDYEGDGMHAGVRDSLTKERAFLQKALDRQTAKADPRLRQRYVDLTRDPTLGEKVHAGASNFAEGLGNTLVDTLDFAGRQVARGANAVGAEIDLKDNYYANYMQAMREVAAEWGPDVPDAVRKKLEDDFVTGDLSQGLGSAAGFMLPGAAVGRLSKVAGLSDKAIKLLTHGAVAVEGAAVNGNQLWHEVLDANTEIMQRAESMLANEQITQRDYDAIMAQVERQAAGAEAWGAVIGTTEAIPLGTIAGRLAKVRGADTVVGKYLNKVVTEGKTPAATWMKKQGVKALKASFEGTEEFTQEALSNTLNNLVARGDLPLADGWDKDREIYDMQTVESGQVGFVTGALLSAISQALPGKQRIRKKREGAETGKPAEATPPAEGQADPFTPAENAPEAPAGNDTAVPADGDTTAQPPQGEQEATGGQQPSSPVDTDEDMSNDGELPAKRYFAQAQTADGQTVTLESLDSPMDINRQATEQGLTIQGTIKSELVEPDPATQEVAPATQEVAQSEMATNEQSGFVPAVDPATPSGRRTIAIGEAVGLSEQGQRAVKQAFDIVFQERPELADSLNVELVSDADFKQRFGQSSAGVQVESDGDGVSIVLNREHPSMQGDKAVTSVFHETGHVVGRALDGFIAEEWGKLSAQQRKAAAAQYSQALSEMPEAELADSYQARQEWFTYQWHRLATGEVNAAQLAKEGYPKQFVQKLQQLVEQFRALVKDWIGDANLSTEALDKRIREILGNYKSTLAEQNAPAGERQTGKPSMREPKPAAKQAASSVSGRKQVSPKAGKPSSTSTAMKELRSPDSAASNAPSANEPTTIRIARQKLPDVIIAHPLATATAHPDYKAAKLGDIDAAYRLARDLVDDTVIERVRESLGSNLDSTVIGVRAQEGQGDNMIPLMVADRLAQALGLELDSSIYQSNRPERTKKDGLDRIFSQVEFAGPVVKDGKYFMVDDTLSQGGTFMGLASHIEANGGEVIGAFTLTGKQYSRRLQLSDPVLKKVREKYGDLEAQFRQATGYGFDALSESEARYLATFKQADRVRDRILEEADASSAGKGKGTGRDGSSEGSEGVALFAPSDGMTEEQRAVYQRVNASLEDKRSYRQRFLDWRNRVLNYDLFREKVVDDLHGIRRMAREIYGEGADFHLDAIDHPWKMAHLTRELGDIMSAWMERGTYRMEKSGDISHNEKSKGFAQIIEPLEAYEHKNPETGKAEKLNLLPSWESYVSAYRADRLLEEGREHNFGFDRAGYDAAIAEGKDVEPIQFWDAKRAREEIDAALSLAKTYPVLEKVRKEYAQWNKALLDFAESAGIIDPEKRKQWDNQDYVPFFRVAEEAEVEAEMVRTGKVTGPKGRETLRHRIYPKRLKGGFGQVAVLENITMNMQYLLQSSLVNQTKQKVADLGVRDNRFIEREPVKPTAFKTDKKELLTRLAEERYEELKAAGELPARWKGKSDFVKNIVSRAMAGDFAALGIDAGTLDAQISLWRAQAPTAPNIMTVMVKGKPQYFKVNDPMLLRSVIAMGPENYKKFLDKVLKYLGIPKKILTNMVTLNPGFFLVSNPARDTVAVWVQQHQKMKLGVDAAKGWAEAMKKEGRLANTLSGAGAGGGTYHALTTSQARKAIAKMTKRQRQAYRSSLLDTPQKVGAFFMRLVHASENANRYAVAKRVMQEGKSNLEAAFQAKDVINFTSKGGSVAVQILTQTIPFLNARIQGLERLARGGKTAPGNRKLLGMRREFATHGLMIMGASMILLALNWDDERYWELPQWEREQYHHIFIGKEHFRIPKAFEVGAIFSTIPELLMSEGHSKQDSDLTGGIKRMITSTFALDWPQVVKPFVEMWQNRKSFTDAPILGLGDQFKLPEDQYNEFTSETARVVADAMPDNAPEWMRSPKRLEALWQGYTGTLGMYAMDMSDMLVRKAANMPDSPAKNWKDWPVLSGMVGRFWRSETPRPNRYVGEFYDMYNVLQEATQRAEYYRRAGKVEQLGKVIDENLLVLDNETVLKNAYADIADIREAQQDIMADPVMSAEDKKAAMDELTRKRNELAKQAVKEVGN